MNISSILHNRARHTNTLMFGSSSIMVAMCGMIVLIFWCNNNVAGELEEVGYNASYHSRSTSKKTLHCGATWIANDVVKVELVSFVNDYLSWRIICQQKKSGEWHDSFSAYLYGSISGDNVVEARKQLGYYYPFQEQGISDPRGCPVLKIDGVKTDIVDENIAILCFRVSRGNFWIDSRLSLINGSRIIQFEMIARSSDDITPHWSISLGTDVFQTTILYDNPNDSSKSIKQDARELKGGSPVSFSRRYFAGFRLGADEYFIVAWPKDEENLLLRKIQWPAIHTGIRSLMLDAPFGFIVDKYKGDKTPELMAHLGEGARALLVHAEQVRANNK